MNIGKSVTDFRNPSQNFTYEWTNPYTLLRIRLGGTGMIVWATEICIDVKAHFTIHFELIIEAVGGKLTDASGLCVGHK